jgi:hypothetical protein
MCISRFGDADDTFQYVTTRKVAIRDRRLGLTALLSKLIIFAYAVAWEIVANQQYLKPGRATGTARLSLQRPSAAYRSAPDTLPYCAGVNASSDPSYAVEPGTYAYTGVGGLATQQLPCLFLDGRFAAPVPAQPNEIVMPTRITTIKEAVAPASACGTQGHDFCEWTVTNQSTALVADAEMFTLMLQHSVAADGGYSKGGAEVSGFLLDSDARVVDPCQSYAAYTAGCPAFITVGNRSRGDNDIVSLRTLLRAGGVQTLDQAAGQTPTFAVQTARYAGVVMVLTLSYTNYYLPGGGVPFGTGSMDASVVRYGLQAQVIPETEFKEEAVFMPGSAFPSLTRTTYNRHGIRIVVRVTARIGSFSLQALLINLMVSLGLLSLAALVTDWIALNICAHRAIFRQYMLRKTVDMSDVLDARHLRHILKRFEHDENLIDSVPPALTDSLRRHRRTLRVRARHTQLTAERKTLAAAIGLLQRHRADREGDEPAHSRCKVQPVAGLAVGVSERAGMEGGSFALEIEQLQRAIAQLDVQLGALAADADVHQDHAEVCEDGAGASHAGPVIDISATCDCALPAVPGFHSSPAIGLRSPHAVAAADAVLCSTHNPLTLTSPVHRASASSRALTSSPLPSRQPVLKSPQSSTPKVDAAEHGPMDLCPLRGDCSPGSSLKSDVQLQPLPGAGFATRETVLPGAVPATEDSAFDIDAGLFTSPTRGKQAGPRIPPRGDAAAPLVARPMNTAAPPG